MANPTAIITTPTSNVYVGQTVTITVMISDAESNNVAGTIYQSLNDGVSTYWSEELMSFTGLGQHSVTYKIPETTMRVWSTVGFRISWGVRGYEIDNPENTFDVSGPSGKTLKVIANTPPRATFTSIGNVYAGATAHLEWSFEDDQGASYVKSKTLERYYKARGSSSWTKAETITLSDSARSADDSLPGGYEGGSVYWVLNFADKVGAEASQTTDTFDSLRLNSPPASPASISYNSTVTVSSSSQGTLAVSWDASVSQNVSGYQVERQYDEAGSWVQVYNNPNPSTLTFNASIEAGHSNVAFRVRAFYNGGSQTQYSTPWTVGGLTKINIAPPKPASITVPATLSSGASAVIKWSAVTDPNGDSVTYQVQRKVDNGNWTTIKSSTASTNYTDTIGANWSTVAYRVRAKDADGAYSGYTESQTRTISSNHAPTISCQYSDNENLGIKATKFSFTYSVDDADPSDTLTVKEYVDGTVYHTFTATRNQNYTYNFGTQTRWDNLENGPHTIKIEVSDTKSTTALNLLFTKAGSGISVTLTNPILPDGQIRFLILSLSYTLPYDDLYSAEPQNYMNIARFNEAFTKIDVTNKEENGAPIWESCLFDTTQTIHWQGKVCYQGNNIWVPMKEGHLMIIHKFNQMGNRFNYLILADTENVSDLGHLCSVQGTFVFKDLPLPVPIYS